MHWAYGVTTIPERRNTTLSSTLKSLSTAGFAEPHLFVDGDSDYASWTRQFATQVTMRFPRVQAFANWMLSLVELWCRHPLAERYVIFQDDILACRNMRSYLEQMVLHPKTYWNLYTFPSNDGIAKKRKATRFFDSNQLGFGALGLVFNRQGVLDLLMSDHFVTRPACPKNPHKSIDGCVVSALRKAGYREKCHTPSLLQHTGEESSISNPKQPKATTFKGESFDAMELLNGIR